MTLTESSASDDNGEQDAGHKETEESEKQMDKNRSFKQEFEQNRAFCQKAKDFLRENYCGRYVIIGAGQLLDVFDTYDLAIEKANKLQRKLLHVMVFKAEEEPFFGTIKFGMRLTDAHPEK